MLESSGKDKVFIYFDGVCGLCNQFVDFLVEKDQRDIFRFIPLQSDRAQKSLPSQYTQGELGTVVVDYKSKLYFKSKAVLMALSKLHRFGFIYRISLVLPQFILDRAYDFVARRRYAWFGRLEQCRMPSEKEKHKFPS